MNRVHAILLLALLSCATAFGQATYMGLTAGKSTRADVERVLGQPVKELSKTLVEYNSPEADTKLFVQYSDESPAAVAERIELTCFNDDDAHGKCSSVLDAIGPLSGVLEDASSSTLKPEGQVIKGAGECKLMATAR